MKPTALRLWIAKTATLVLAACFLAACGGGSTPPTDAEDIIHTGCTANSDCEGGRCVTGFPSGGMCTSNCGDEGDCPNGTLCADTEAHGGICLFPCTSSAECQELVGQGYVCDTESDLTTGEDIRVCID